MKGTGSGSHHEKQVEVLIGRTKGIAISKASTELLSILSNQDVFDGKLHIPKLLISGWSLQDVHGRRAGHVTTLLCWKSGKILDEKMRLALHLITGTTTLRLKVILHLQDESAAIVDDL